MEEIRTESKKSKLIFDPRIARKLIHLGNTVCDIKPLRNDPDKTVIVFVDTEKFQKDFIDVVAEMKAKDEAKHKSKDDEPESLELAD